MREESLRGDIIAYIGKRYGIVPSSAGRGGKAVFRREADGRPFAVLTDVLTLRITDIYMMDELLHHDGITPGRGRGLWISIALDGTVSCEDIIRLVDMSHEAAGCRRKAEVPRGPKEWLIPANPKIYDIVHAFDDGTDTISWRTHRGIRAGDTIFIYVTLPVAAILFKCSVLAADIPEGDRRIMRIKLLRRYREDEFTRQMLFSEYGIYSVRGPRSVPYSLSCMLGR